MSRDGLTSGMQTAVAAGVVAPILLCEIQTASGYVRAWSGIGDLPWNGNTYNGTGNFGGVTPVQETNELQANGVSFTLSGVPAAMVSTALADMRQGRSTKLWLGAFDMTTGALIADPYQLFWGLTDVPSIDDGAETATIGITAENRLIDLDRARTRRLTSEDQALDDPTDLGFKIVPSLQDQEFIW